MTKLKMLLVPGMVLGMSVMLSAADAKSVTVPAPDAQAAGADLVAQMNQKPQGTPIAKAFAFLPETVATVGGKKITKAEFINALV